jgi:hypothetical protein
MFRVFISGPYSAPTEYEVSKNIWRAREEAALWWKMGAAVFCPHTNSGFFGGLVDVNAFYKGDLDFLQACHGLVAVPGWESSLGSVGEVEYARFLDLRVFFPRKGTSVDATPLWELDSTKEIYTTEKVANLCRTYNKGESS